MAISGRRQEALDSAAEALRKEGIEVHTAQGDVRDYASTERMVSSTVARFGKLNILVNCAAGNFLVPAEKMSSNAFRTVLEIDTLGTFNVSRAAFEALKASATAAETSSVINISATLHYGATWYQAHASAAKAAIDSLTRTLGLEWGQDNIRVNGIAPGPISGTAGMAKLAPVDPEVAERVVGKTVPLGRMGSKKEIGYAAVYLASAGASFVSGHVLVVDGAAWIWRDPGIPKDKVIELSRGVEGKSRKVGVGGDKSKL